jgi:hypothetical protein
MKYHETSRQHIDLSGITFSGRVLGNHFYRLRGAVG